jgi:hypothetical protein
MLVTSIHTFRGIEGSTRQRFSGREGRPGKDGITSERPE